MYKRQAEGVLAAELEALTETPGMGLTARFDGQDVSLGRAERDAAQADLACRFTTAGEPAVTLRFSDRLRPGAEALPRELAQLGLDCSILSGDRAAAVATVARALGITALTSLLPDEKLAAIGRLSRAGARILMVGDGLNLSLIHI